MEELSIPIVAPFFLAIAVVFVTIRLFSSSYFKTDTSNIPWAPDSIPILGHALKYRHNPAQFLLHTKENVGDIFQLNLAGKRMIVACGPTAQRIIGNAPESIMSARNAIANIGFEEMLGHRNVYEGTDLHKGIIKGLWHSSEQSEVVLGYIKAVRDALRVETSSLQKQQKVEFMTLIRRVALRAVIELFIGPFFLDDWDYNFIDEFMKFQDDLEDVTAKAAVMPRFLALPFLLWPFRRRRLRLEQIITKRLELTILDAPKEMLGFWLAAVQDSYPLDGISHFIIGLLFAAHKNPAIGTAQSYLMLHERATPDQQKECIKESEIFLSNPPSLQIQESCPTLYRLCLEALRLTAHSIGGLRTASKDFSIGNGMIIPKGSTVALAHIPSSFDAELWKDPDTLDLNINSNNRSMELYENDYAFTVFSCGMHKCPGRRFALTTLPCAVAILLIDYEIDLPETIPPLCFERATLAQRAGPVYVVISRKE